MEGIALLLPLINFTVSYYKVLVLNGLIFLKSALIFPTHVGDEVGN